MAMKRAIGLMSGTSLDGIDVALIESDGERLRVVRSANNLAESLGPSMTVPYSEAEQTLLREATRDAESIRARADRPGRLIEAERFVTEAHARAVERFLSDFDLTPAEIDVIGFHGQTVIHRPRRGVPGAGLTVQIGDGAALARRLGIAVVADLRGQDVAAGGEGAPLVPVFHRALAAASGLTWPLGILNVGGLANITLIDRGGGLFAFDTGPGNGPINDWMKDRENRAFDENGATANRGQVDEELLAHLLDHPLIRRTPPKSLDRNWFSHKLAGYLSTEDGAATLTAFAAHAVARSLSFVPEAERPARLVVAGGGAANPTFVRMLKQAVAAEVSTAEELGWSSAHLEAQAFAYLAVRSTAGLPITYPTTTGVPVAMTGGSLHRP